MKALVIGAGMMGSAMAYDLAHSEGVDEIILVDSAAERAQSVARSVGRNIRPLRLDVGYYDDLVALMNTVDVALGATSYSHNYMLTRAAIEARIHFCDLGGNMDVVDRQLSLDPLAKKAGVCIIPNCGLAPGLACVVAAGGAKKFENINEIHIRVGGLPQHPLPPLNYQLVFSAEGLINECLEPAEIIRDGKRRKVESMTDCELLVFPPPFESLEAFNTSGGVSTLTRMFEGRVHQLDYKTIRYRGHCEKFKTLLDLGFASSEPVTVGSSTVTVREFFEDLLRKKLSSGDPDVTLMRVTVSGVMSGSRKILAYEMLDYYDRESKMTSMMRTTAFPTSIIAQMVVNGTIQERGVMPPEQCVPLGPLIAGLQKRNIIVNEITK